jgi:hypothetical protein
MSFDPCLSRSFVQKPPVLTILAISIQVSHWICFLRIYTNVILSAPAVAAATPTVTLMAMEAAMEVVEAVTVVVAMEVATAVVVTEAAVTDAAVVVPVPVPAVTAWATWVPV